VKRFGVFLVVIGLLAAPSSAAAAIYSGRASDGTTVKLRTNSNGTPERVTFGRYKADCTNGYRSLANPIRGFVPPFTRASPDRISDRGAAQDQDGRNAVKARWIFGAHRTSDDHWRGSYWSKGKFLHDGDAYTVCSASFDFELKPR
jgi:hypothetical protein